MKPDDLTRLRHMLDASQAALSFIEGETRESLDTDRKLVFALIRAVEIVGEAAAQVSLELRAKQSQIPWTQIVGMRNRLIHAYFAIDLDQVWSTVTIDLPPLIATLEKVITEQSE